MKNSIKIFHGCILAYICIGFVLTATFGYQGVSKLYNFPVMARSFSDITNLVWGAQSIANGYDPLFENPSDEFGRKMNHPRILQHIVSTLHLERFTVEQVASVVITIFLVAFALTFRELDRWSAILLSIAAISPPVILAIERCNHDLIVFSLIVLGLRFTRGASLFFGLSLLAAFIKLFPIFTITYFLKYDWKRWLAWSFAFGGIFVAYLLFTWSDLAQVFHSTEKSFGYSYGAKVIMTIWAPADDPFFTKVALIPVVAMIVSLTISLLCSYGSTGWFLTAPKSEYIDAFRVGAGVFLGSYLIGNNWDYRLIYLLLTIPQLTHWATVGRLALAQIALALIFVSLFVHWAAPFGRNQFLVDETSNWILFGLLFMLMFRSVSLGIMRAVLPMLPHPQEAPVDQ